jgi:hypothetical protein
LPGFARFIGFFFFFLLIWIQPARVSLSSLRFCLLSLFSVIPSLFLLLFSQLRALMGSSGRSAASSPSSSEIRIGSLALLAGVCCGRSILKPAAFGRCSPSAVLSRGRLQVFRGAAVVAVGPVSRVLVGRPAL